MTFIEAILSTAFVYEQILGQNEWNQIHGISWKDTLQNETYYVMELNLTDTESTWDVMCFFLALVCAKRATSRNFYLDVPDSLVA